MNRIINKTRLTAAACLLGTLASGTALAASEDNWSFDVYLDNKPIGYHSFELDGSAGDYTLTTRASFDVKILFINAFRYRHENVETWADGCLTGISARTDNNGEALRVDGEAMAGSFIVSSSGGEQVLPDCVQTFAYWNPEILTAERLLNSQTGEFETVDIVFEEREVLAVDGQEIEADRYALTTKEKTIRLWYSTVGERWLALEAPARGDRKLRYQAVNLPPTLSDTQVVEAD